MSITIKELQQSNNPKTILENEWVTIVKWDILYELRKNSFFKDIEFNKKADHIFPWDQIIVKLWKIIIKREWKEINVWKIHFNKIKEETKENIKEIKPKQESKVIQSIQQPVSAEQNQTRVVQKIKPVEQKDIIQISNPEIKKTFEQVLSKHNIAYITKQDLLRMSNNNYYVATSILMSHYNEQRRWKGTRENIKSIAWGIEKWLGIHTWMVKSIWEFQIRYTDENLSTKDISTFFNNYNNWKYKNLSFMRNIIDNDKKTLDRLSNSFIRNKNLSLDDRREFLELKEVSRLMANIYMTNRFNTTAGLFVNTPKWKNKDNDFMILTNVLEWYHAWWTTFQNTTNKLLKVWEKMWVLRQNWIFQEIIKEKYKSDFTWFNWVNITQRQSEVLQWIIDWLIKMMSTLQAKENIKKSHHIDDTKYNKILKWLIDYKNNPNKITNVWLRYSVNELTAMYGVNFKDFTIVDYMNTDPKKAVLLWNYWPNAYKALIK